MSTVVAQSILTDATRLITPYSQAHGARPDSLLASATDDVALWNDACERMLAWRSAPDEFDGDDQPSIEILDTAIDYAVDERDRGGPAPTIVVPSGGNKIAFEWHARRCTMIIEFIGCGYAKYTKFVDGRVIEKGVLERNPRTRKMELGG